MRIRQDCPSGFCPFQPALGRPELMLNTASWPLITSSAPFCRLPEAKNSS
jgi:hypothetical protein